MADKTVSGLIEQIDAGSNLYNIASTAYGYCETAAGTAAKVVAIAGFKYKTGVTIHVKFRYENTASSNLTLNVNSEGAKPIVLNSITAEVSATSAGTNSETTGWKAGAVVAFTYDGTNWVRDQGYNTNTTYSLSGLGGIGTITASGTSPLTLNAAKDANDATKYNITGSLANAYGDTQNPYGTKNKNLVLASSGTTNGVAPSFRALVAADIPDLNASKITGGQLGVAYGGTGASTFTSGEVLIGNGANAITTKAIDTTVTASSNNLITSGAVASAISGLTGAMHFLGVSTTAITDGGTQNPTIGGNSITTKTAGDVVIYGDQEYVWSTTNKWELLGDEGSYALKTAVIDKSIFTAIGQMLYARDADDPAIVAPNTTASDKILWMKGTGTAGAAPSWKTISIKTTGHTAKAITAIAYTANSGSWSTLNKGSGVSISGVDTAGTPTDATVTDAVLIITKGTATTKATAQTVPKLQDLSLTNGTWPTLNPTKDTDFLTGAEIQYS